ncbi:MAG: metalloenzyme [Oscillochloris sp.]|nr:metalloenzyme [Oscillochloris sp.]
MAIIFVFLDGVGLAPAGPNNPFTTVPMLRLQQLLGGPLSLEHVQQRAGLLLQPIDAALGVAGAPQSGTGHVALLAGVNAPAMHGRHQPNFPPTALRPLLAERSVLRRARAAGHAVAFANVFTPGYWQAIASRRVRRSASVIAAEGAGVRLRTLDDFAAGRALSWDITGAMLQLRGEGPDLAPVAPEEAGAWLAAFAHEHELVFFESFMTDLAGHGRLGVAGIGETLLRVDGMIGGVLDTLRSTDTLLITSDHGNLEDTSIKGHTEAAVPLLAVGPAAAHFAAVRRIDQVAEAILAVLG